MRQAVAPRLHHVSAAAAEVLPRCNPRLGSLDALGTDGGGAQSQ